MNNSNSSSSSTPRQIAMSLVNCPVCSKEIAISSINKHLDSGCKEPPGVDADAPPKKLASIFTTPSAKRQLHVPPQPQQSPTSTVPHPPPPTRPAFPDLKRPLEAEPKPSGVAPANNAASAPDEPSAPPTKRQKATAVLREAMPLAEKMRPQSLDDVCGQDLVGKGGVLRGLIEKGRVPSMILWGTAGCGKTTIARVIAKVSSARFVEISATASGVQECKKIFADAKKELLLTGTKTILFCDEIHRFTKSQQDVFLAPVEKGEITL